MTENLLKEAMDCGWVTMGIRFSPPPPVWKFVVDFSKRWSTMDEPDFLDLLDVTVRWEKEIPKGQGGTYTAYVYLDSQWYAGRRFETTIRLPSIFGTKPEEEWAKEAARRAVLKAIEVGRLDECEQRLASGPDMDWRNWRKER